MGGLLRSNPVNKLGCSGDNLRRSLDGKWQREGRGQKGQSFLICAEVSGDHDKLPSAYWLLI
jgi:hypothetical protein